jgi:uncharacterized BrkB/YihY/UPF0761 family membrane protein
MAPGVVCRKRAIVSFHDDQGTHQAGALTCYALMSLFRVLLPAVSLLGLLRVVLTPSFAPKCERPIPTRRAAGATSAYRRLPAPPPLAQATGSGTVSGLSRVFV